MKVAHVLTLCASSLVAVTLSVQAQTYVADHTSSDHARSFALVVNSNMNYLQSHSGYAGKLVRYVHDHPAGTFVVFDDNGVLHRIDDPARIKQIRDFYAPMQALEAQQKALARAQRPLADTQKTLADQQHAATDPRDQGRIGEAQGTVGQDQGSIGAQQGEIGRQQGEVARAAFQKVQGVIERCLADGSCPRVAS